MNNNQIRLCLNCGIIGETHVHSHWKSNIIEPYGSSDICEICGKETVIDIDSEIAHYIYRLNKMGYKTAYSCAGHAISNYSEAYILFSNDCFDKLKNILTKEKLGYDITDEKSDVVLYRIRIYKDISDNIHYLNNEYYQKYTLPGNGFDRAAGFEYIGDSCKLQVNTDFISERDELAEESGGYIYVDETMQARREFYKVLNIIMDSEEV